MAAAKRVTKEQLLAAIKACGGIAEHIAKKVKISRQAVLKRIKADEELQAAAEDAKQAMLDEAEFGLHKAVKAGKPWAIRLALTRLGKDRGYSMGVHVEGKLEQSGQVVLTLPDDGRESGSADGSSQPGR